MTLSPGADLFPLLAGVLAALTCGLLGNFLVLRRLSLMGDAISHSVLPGLVIAFIVSATRSPVAMFVGAAAAGVVTVALVELVKRLGRVEPGAAMGVVFSVLFALGVLLVEHAARAVDLDADCVLHGQLETLAWYGAPARWGEVGLTEAINAAPRQVVVLVVACLATAAFVTLLFKELRLAAFDPGLATVQGFSAELLHYALMIFVAIATVASFEAVGSILVIAMLVCPAASARMVTDRLRAQILWSAGFAVAGGVLGYVAASGVPALFGKDSVNAAGSMAVVSGMILAGAIVASPRHGLAAKWLRRRALAGSVGVDDVLGVLFRAREGGRTRVALAALSPLPLGRPLDAVLARAARDGLVTLHAAEVELTGRGLSAAANVVRRHRLWECYLVAEAGVAPDHVHLSAERLEHAPVQPGSDARADPHGRVIPAVSEPPNLGH
ncbi:MAG: metal ABC transporter permease [Planctomycetota bacterium]|nr:metal ABC transporter permease [Planctomycetota bacterium]